MFADSYFMNLALQQAREAARQGEVPIGAVIVCRDTIIAKAYNQVERLKDATAHAEMLALTAAAATLGSKYLPDCKLYVTLEPCPMCAGATYLTQIGSIIYGATDSKRGYTQFGNLLHPKTIVTADLMPHECGALLTDFFKAKR